MQSSNDPDLPEQMANLDLMEVTDANKEAGDSIAEPTARRILRKRKSLAIDEPKKSNRRVNMKPRKHLQPDCANTKQIEALYLNKTVKTTSQTLETIYEETMSENETVTFIGGRKLKRVLTFPLGSQYTKEKLRKRRAKIKKLFGNKYINRKKIPMEVVLETIGHLDLDE